MPNFTFTPPYIHPHNYKDKEGMETVKWFIRFSITIDGVTSYPKEYGKSYSTALNINKPKKHRLKISNAEILLKLINTDLEGGINPKNRKEEMLLQLQRELNDAHKFKILNVFNEWFKAKNYINPIPAKEISAKTYKNFWMNQLIPHLESIGKAEDIKEITDGDIRNWLMSSYESGHWSALTINIKIGYINNVFKFAFLKKYIIKNPMNYVIPIKEDKVIVKNGISSIKVKRKPRFNILSDEEIALFDKFFNLKTRTMTKTLMYSFVRFSELYRLRLKHLDIINWCWNIPAELAKGQRDGSTATIKIYPVLQNILKEYLNEFFGDDMNPEYYLFFTEDKNNKTSIDYVSYQFRQAKLRIEKAGDITVFVNGEKKVLTNIKIDKTPYCFKHTGAKRFVDQNKSKSRSSYEIIEGIMKMMRHTNFNTSQIYIYKELGINLDANDSFSFD